MTRRPMAHRVAGRIVVTSTPEHEAIVRRWQRDERRRALVGRLVGLAIMGASAALVGWAVVVILAILG